MLGWPSTWRSFPCPCMLLDMPEEKIKCCSFEMDVHVHDINGCLELLIGVLVMLVVFGSFDRLDVNSWCIGWVLFDG